MRGTLHGDGIAMCESCFMQKGERYTHPVEHVLASPEAVVEDFEEPMRDWAEDDVGYWFPEITDRSGLTELQIRLRCDRCGTHIDGRKERVHG